MFYYDRDDEYLYKYSVETNKKELEKILDELIFVCGNIERRNDTYIGQGNFHLGRYDCMVSNKFLYRGYKCPGLDYTEVDMYSITYDTYTPGFLGTLLQNFLNNGDVNLISYVIENCCDKETIRKKLIDKRKAIVSNLGKLLNENSNETDIIELTNQLVQTNKIISGEVILEDSYLELIKKCISLKLVSKLSVKHLKENSQEYEDIIKFIGMSQHKLTRKKV